MTAPVSLKYQINGRMYEYLPMQDITAFEAAMLQKLITVSVGSLVPNEPRVKFIEKYDLMRHFTEVFE